MSWIKTSLFDVTERIGDGLHGTPKYNDKGDYFFINGNNFVNGKILIKEDTKKIDENEYLKIKKDLNERTVFVSINGTLGKVAFYKNEKIALGKSACYLNVKHEVDKRFIRYVLEDTNFQNYAKNYATGSTIKNLGLKAVRNYSFDLPNYKTQKRIADILSAYDDLIENNLKRIKLLEQAAQNIFKEWFVNMRFPDHENTPIDQETGLPEGWEEKALGDFIEIKKGKNITKSTIIEGNVPVVAGGLKPAYYHNVSNTLNPVITISASGANAGFVNIYLEDIWASDCSYIDSNLSDSVLFVHNLLLHQQKFIFSMQRGSAQPHVYPKDLKRGEFIIPDKILIQKFEERVSPKYKMKRVLLNQNQKLKSARDILLPRLMNQTIEV